MNNTSNKEIQEDTHLIDILKEKEEIVNPILDDAIDETYFFEDQIVSMTTVEDIERILNIKK